MNPPDSASGGSPKRYYGKYRGLVIENIDPEQIGRVMVQVPAVKGELPSSWAMPCVPAAGIHSGCFIVPPIGSPAWRVFEQGATYTPSWAARGSGGICELVVLRTAPPTIAPVSGTV